MALSRSSITRDGLEKQKGVRDDLKIIPSLTLKMKSFSIKYSIQHQQFISLYSYIIFIQALRVQAKFSEKLSLQFFFQKHILYLKLFKRFFIQIFGA